MVRATYAHGKSRIACDATANRFLLTNDRGEYVQLGAPNLTNYDGLFLKLDDAAYYKTLWNLLPAGELREVIVRAHSVIRRFEDAEHQIALTSEGMLARCSGEHTLTLDCKRRYDESEEHRLYTISHTPAHSARAQRTALARVSTFDVTYEKQGAYTLYLTIATTMDAASLGKWRAVPYSYDDRRGTHATRWVYDAITLSGEGLVAISAGRDRALAHRSALSMLVHAKTALEIRIKEDAGEKIPRVLAARALRTLTTREGTIAGVPWFTQIWSRDELIALGGLLAIGEHEFVLRALDRWHASVRKDGTLPAIHPDEGLVSADAPGWLGVRTLHVLSHPGLRAQMTRARLRSWEAAQRRLLERIASDMRDGLVWSGSKMTWMDTDGDGGGRSGARVEIQALAIALCDAHTALCKRLAIPAAPFDTMSQTIASSVRARLVRGDALLDGLWDDGSADTTIRPNVFLAWYAYPQLFSPSQWRVFFARVLTALWLPWGGLASIEKTSQHFHPSDTGEDTAAYHAGDSWYFVNNIAALALHEVGSFATNARALVAASIRDLLTLGVLGHASEISSAGEQEACGCHAQAWSASTLLEALDRIELSAFSKS